MGAKPWVISEMFLSSPAAANRIVNTLGQWCGAINIANKVTRMTNTAENALSWAVQYSDAIPLAYVGTEGWQAYFALKQAGGGAETIRFRPSGASYINGGGTGFGTSTPQERVHVSGNLTVTGAIKTGGGDSASGVTRIDASGNATLASITCNLPTADPHVLGRFWSDGGIVKVSAG